MPSPKYTETDSELAWFARLLALPVRVYIVRKIIENNNAISKKDICNVPFEMENILKHITELKALGLVKTNGSKLNTIYSVDIALFNRVVSKFVSLFGSLNSVVDLPVVSELPETMPEKKEPVTTASYTTSFGELIKKYRRSLKMSQEELGRLVGIDRSELSRIECGKKSPGAEKLPLLSHALKTDIDTLSKEYYSFRIVNLVEESGFSGIVLESALAKMNYLFAAG